MLYKDLLSISNVSFVHCIYFLCFPCWDYQLELCECIWIWTKRQVSALTVAETIASVLVQWLPLTNKWEN